MKALILAAGLGTRLKPIINTVPKCMVEVGGKPVLEHLVEHLHKFGIVKIVVNLHYLPKPVMDHFGTVLIYSFEPRLLGEVGTIRSLYHWLGDDDLVVMNGDTLTNVDLQEMLNIRKKDELRVFVDRDLETCAGTWLISREGLYRIYKDKTVTQMKDLKNILSWSAYCSPNSWWIDIGTPERLQQAREFYEQTILPAKGTDILS